MSDRNTGIPHVSIGIDIGDRTSFVFAVDQHGEILEEAKIPTTPAGMQRKFEGMKRARIALEASTHSPWMEQLLTELGHEVIVANPRKLRLIYENPMKSDRMDAEQLARLARLDVRLLSPIKHRGPEARAALTLLRSRDVLVRARTMLVNHVRTQIKVWGVRAPKCSTEAFHKKALEHVPEQLESALLPVISQIEWVTTQVRAYDREVEQVCTERYPETERLRRISGVGPLTALCFVLTIEDPRRFKRSSDVGAYLGMVPRRFESGARSPQLRITKCGDRMLRRLLVGAAQYVLGPFGTDTDLRRFGLRLAERGGQNAKKRAVVATARKLSVLLLAMWKAETDYVPLRIAA